MDLPTQYRYLYNPPTSQATIRQLPEDFHVVEIPSFIAEGEGEHEFLLIRKTGENTDWVAKLLAKFCQIPIKDVGYAGKKDRHAVTEQWFSVRLPMTRKVNWALFGGESIHVLESVRHQRKLRLGALLGNRFSIRLRDLTNEDDFVARLEKIKAGVPNYFGEQRFGHGGGNLTKGLALINGEFKERQRHKKGLYISAVRSWLFNHIVSERIAQNLWDNVLPGDMMMLSGSRSHFLAEAVDESLLSRLKEHDLHLSGPLWGRGSTLVQGEAAEWEGAVIHPWESVTERLEHLGLQQERRALRLIPEGLKAVKESDGQWLLSFSLPAGSFATSVLRELCEPLTAGIEDK
ncbi:tRNA pseudouridine(13) synthase TruD [Neptunomonas japonica]|uniref:tRNA pseudouridine(13) synthase TruD n=1 Tax=Neptunomonas japonica TaxID=417574 RepID=UPI0004235EF4|nr:tRNA pseudouridine(13) synthase TruD [Neptunomonas japonica]